MSEVNSLNQPRTGDCCDLCGLSLRRGRVTADYGAKTYSFCCPGCRQVFAILMAAAETDDPADFKNTETFKQCAAAGIIPVSEADLDRIAATAQPPTATPDQTESDTAADLSDEASLELNLTVSNMWCPACAWLIDTALTKSTGVSGSQCNFSTDRLKVIYHPVRTSPARIIADIAKLGYQADEPGQDRRTLSQKKEFIRFGICAFLTMNVMMLSFSLYSGFLIELSSDNISKIAWPMLAMTAAVLGYGGYDFFRKTFSGLRNLTASMETLIIIGATSAFILSMFNQTTGSLHLYYDTACMLITLVLLGKTLESRAKRRVLEDLETFFALMPTKVRLCSSQYPQGRYAAVDRLERGEHFRVEAGEIVPADGMVVTGEGGVDESAITGEPRPVSKTAGDLVRSGSRILNGDLVIEARQVGDQSTLGQMIAIIEKTLLSKTPLEGKTDALLRWFVPAILLLAAGTFIFCILAGMSMQAAILRAVTVTVISCPCALGIAIPLARVAGVSIAGKLGLLVRDFAAFEQAERIDTVVFDKTGTITEGRWELLDTIAYHDFDPDQAIALAAGLEMGSDHFIAVEIRRQAVARQLEPLAVADIISEDGGLTGKIGERIVKIGSAASLAADFKDQSVHSNLEKNAGGRAHSSVFLSDDGKPAAVFIFGDTLRPKVTEVLNDLTDRGFQLAMISGDGHLTTAAVGRELGFETALGGQMPADKADFIRGLQTQGRHTAMVGDGINDAPALAQADLAIAIYSGGALAKEAADVSFMRGDPHQLPLFLDFAAGVNRKIRQNLIFTFAYNLLAIPIAMSGLLNPLVAVCAMLLSSISVTGNTLLMVRNPKGDPS